MATNKMDPFKSATAVVDEEKAKMLKAAAQAGSAGIAAYEEARNANNVSQQEAVARALAASQVGGVGAGGGLGQGMQELAPLQHQALNTAQAGFSSGLENMKASNESYMGKLGATLPILQEQNQLKATVREQQLQAIAAEKVRQQQAAAAAEQSQRDWEMSLAEMKRKYELEDRDFALKQSEAERAWKSKEGALDRGAASAKSSEMSDAELAKYLTGGAERVQQEARGVASQPLPNFPGLQGAGMPGLSQFMSAANPDPAVQQLASQQSSARQLINQPLSEIARSIGIDVMQLDPNRVYGVIKNKLAQPTEHEAIAKATRVSGGADTVSAILSNPTVNTFMDGVTSDPEATPASIKASILADFPGPNKQRTRAVLEYLLT